MPLMVEEHIRKNKRDTLLVCIFMLSLLFAIIFAFGFAIGFPPFIAMSIGLPISIIYILASYSFSVQSVIAAAKARPVNPHIRKEKIFMYKVEEMAIAAGLPVPKAYVQDSSDINAFATGKKPEEAIICVTTGAVSYTHLTLPTILLV